MAVHETDGNFGGVGFFIDDDNVSGGGCAFGWWNVNQLLGVAPASAHVFRLQFLEGLWPLSRMLIAIKDTGLDVCADGVHFSGHQSALTGLLGELADVVE